MPACRAAGKMHLPVSLRYRQSSGMGNPPLMTDTMHMRGKVQNSKYRQPLGRNERLCSSLDVQCHRCSPPLSVRCYHRCPIAYWCKAAQGKEPSGRAEIHQHGFEHSKCRVRVKNLTNSIIRILGGCARDRISCRFAKPQSGSPSPRSISTEPRRPHLSATCRLLPPKLHRMAFQSKEVPLLEELVAPDQVTCLLERYESTTLTIHSTKSSSLASSSTRQRQRERNPI